jgi:hypothetical protein
MAADTPTVQSALATKFITMMLTGTSVGTLRDLRFWKLGTAAEPTRTVMPPGVRPRNKRRGTER